MPTHPLWNPFHLVSDEEIAAARLPGYPPAGPRPVVLAAPDAGWPAAFEALRERITGALGDRALTVEHVGSTSVPGLRAKPVIDVDVLVADPGDEDAWLPSLEAVGLTLVVRNPGPDSRHVLRCSDPVANVHVMREDSREAARHRLFRDFLRGDPSARERYEAAKEAAAAQGFTEVMHYNNAKGAVVYDLYEEAFVADPRHEHDPRPRPRVEG